ncbi:hypothetical protein C8R42DRAFT_413511 [Lentinula raphanica]|nr:hypothetical protein C8R42DRAFT_413511 [Lentinula raphanica]
MSLTINSNDLAIVTSTSTDTSTGTPQTEIVQAAITQAITVDATDSDTKTVSSTSASSSSTLSGTTTSAPSAKVTSTESATTSTAATSSSSSSTSASAKTTSAPTSTSQTETSSSSSTSASSSRSKISSTASVTDSTPLSSSSSTTSSVATPVAISAATTSAGPTTVQVFSTDGHLTTLTTQVFAATSTSSPPPAQSALSTTETFFKNKAAVGGVFGAAGLVFLILLLAIVLKIVRYRSRRQFEKDLDEQVEQEVRSGTPMFGVGKDDDGLSIMGGRVDGFIDPEKAAVARSGCGYPNTTAYPTYGGPIPPQATQQAYYSPNAPSGAPRRSPPQDQSPYSNFHDGSGGLSRTISRSSNRSYGSMQQPPMNAFASTIQNAGPVLAPATFAATTYGPYRHGSPAPSAQSQSWQSQNQAGFGARPGTPLSLTPGEAEVMCPLLRGVCITQLVIDRSHRRFWRDMVLRVRLGIRRARMEMLEVVKLPRFKLEVLLPHRMARSPLVPTFHCPIRSIKGISNVVLLMMHMSL